MSEILITNKERNNETMMKIVSEPGHDQHVCMKALGMIKESNQGQVLK